jgi:antirestriction protein
MSTHTQTTAPRVYVGTYGKYANGSLRGAWVELEAHVRATFLKACLKLHKDEHDPEIMLQDFEGFPRDFYGESGLSDTLWDWLDCSEEERELWEAYAEAVGCSMEHTTLEHAQDAYSGEADSEAEFAEQLVGECFDLSNVPSWLTNCVDWQAVWNSMLRFDYCEHQGKFFRRD